MMKNTFFMRLTIVFAVVFTISFVYSNVAIAQGNKVLLDLVDASDSLNVVGAVKVIEKKNRGDILKLKVKLDQEAFSTKTIRVFLADSPDDGEMPAVFLGDFKTNPQGKGVFQVKVEVFDAFVVTEADPDPVDLDYIRLYLDEDASSSPFGGAHVASTDDFID
jgi:hypothetical protein